MIPSYNAEKIKISYKPISLSFKEVTLLSREEYLENKELIPLLKDGYWWLRSSGISTRRATFVDGKFGDISDNGDCVQDTLGVRPALKIKHYEQLKLGEKVRIKDLYFTVLNDELLLCDTVVGEVMFDKISNNYDTSYIKNWLENWVQENNITFEKE